MSRIEDVVTKTVISGELPIAGACKAFMNQKTNCFGKYIRCSRLCYIKTTCIVQCIV